MPLDMRWLRCVDENRNPEMYTLEQIEECLTLGELVKGKASILNVCTQCPLPLDPLTPRIECQLSLALVRARARACAFALKVAPRVGLIPPNGCTHGEVVCS
jgi:hypothetical protein